jgi:hypothetical protein
MGNLGQTHGNARLRDADVDAVIGKQFHKCSHRRKATEINNGAGPVKNHALNFHTASPLVCKTLFSQRKGGTHACATGHTHELNPGQHGFYECILRVAAGVDASPPFFDPVVPKT